jgi:hypothetical protein
MKKTKNEPEKLVLSSVELERRGIPAPAVGSEKEGKNG